MTRHALNVLGFSRVLDRVAARAASDPGRAELRSRSPGDEPEALRRELARVGAVMRFVVDRPAWGMPSVPDVDRGLRELRVEGSVLEPTQLFAVATLLASGRELADDLDAEMEADGGATLNELASLRARLVEDRDQEGRLFKTVDAEGTVLDSASRELKAVRNKLKGARSRIVRRLEAFLGELPDRLVVSDASVTIREGRYVVPVRREGKSEVGGIIHDESATGATLFVEPPVAMELMNELRDLERQEQREIRRVLGERTAELTPRADALRGSFEALVAFDSLQARARTALAWGAEVPELLDPGAGSFGLVEARHPLLLESEDVDEVVPYDLVVEEGERALVVSGPNTGGKSVFLKATGLIAALAQSGIVPPVGPGTRLPVFLGIWADIGDEQSIARSLSTFSAHLENLKAIVQEADQDALVLMDEMGTGTDPAEGAALARAILEVLVQKGAFSVVSSHLNELKKLDGEGSGIVNASLAFDAEAMEPTYQLVKGRPGRSYGLAIARRLGFPGHVLDRAESYRSEDEVDLEELLARLEARERETEELSKELEKREARTARLEEELEARARGLKEAEESAEDRARRKAREELMEARSEVEKAIEEVRAAAHSAEELDEASRDARRRVEEAAAARHVPDRRDRDGPAPELEEGQAVKVRSTGARGRVVEVRDRRALVEVGAMKLELPATDLEGVDAEEGAGSGRRTRPTGGSRRSSGGTLLDSPDAGAHDAAHEIDLRGRRVHEMEIELSRALDAAVVANLPGMRIIHGKGTGALRQRVGEMLDQDGRVEHHEIAKPREGGAGVTVVRFR